MAYRKTSRDAADRQTLGYSAAQINTMADVLATIDVVDIAPDRRRDIRSALNGLARMSGKTLAEIPATARDLRTLFEGIAPARHMITPGRAANIKSLCFRALDIVGVQRLQPRSRIPVSPLWDHALRPLPSRSLRIPLRTFARFCDRQGVVPDRVDQCTFDAYARELEEFGCRSKPRHFYLIVTRAWNKAAAHNPEWPAFRVEVDDRRDRYALPCSAFPESFKVDIDTMAAEAVAPNLLSATNRRPVKPITAKNRIKTLRAFASGAVMKGADPATFRGIADIVQPEIFKLGLEYQYERAGGNLNASLHESATLICTMAQHWVSVSESQLKELVAIRRRLRRQCHGMTEKNRMTLRNFEDEHIVGRFMGIAQRVWRRHKGRSSLTRSQAVEQQTALAIELLTVAPVRRGNLVAIRLGKNIIDTGTGDRRRVHLYFAADEVKNGHELEFSLPDATVELLDDYVKNIRPQLLRVPTDYLFPGLGAHHKQSNLLSNQMAKLVEQEVGVRLTAHQFRHLAGFLYLQKNPGSHEVIRRLLGHWKIQTTIQYYAGMEVRDALRHFDQHIAQRRAALGNKLPKGKKK